MEADQLRADDLYNTPLDPHLQVGAFASMPSSHETNVITIPFYPETPMHFSVPFMPWIQQSPISMHSHSHPLTPSSISSPAVPAGPTPPIPVVADALPQPSPALPLPPPPAEVIEQSPSPPVHSQTISSDDAVPSPAAELTPTATEKKKSKKRPESHDANGIPIPKRPVGRPRKDGKPAGSQGPRKTNRPPGRPRKHPIPNGTTTMSINSSSSPVKQLSSLSQLGTPQSSGGDANPYSPLGPDQASTSAMSLDQPGPSTLPFSQSESSGTPAYDDSSCPAGAMMDQDFNDMSISHSPDTSRSVTSPSMLSSVTCTSASDWIDTWSEQETTNADAFLETLVSLLSSLPSPSPSSSSSSPCSSSSTTTATAPGIIRYTLEQSFKIRLALVRRQSTRASSSLSSSSSSAHLQQHQHQSQPQHHSYLPGVYDLFQSFWLSSSSPYFARTVAPSLQVPSEHRFFFWHPMPLCPGATIICPACGTAPLVDNGPIASGPVRIWDFEPRGGAGVGGGGFYVIGYEYVCRSAVCIAAAAAVNGGGRTFASTDNAILRSLPQALQDDFPAFMMTAHGTREVWDFRTVGVSRAVWALARSLVLRVKMGKQMVVQILAGMQQQQGLASGMGEPDEPWSREERGLQYQQRQQQQRREHRQQEEDDAFGGMRRSSLDHGVQEQSSAQFLHHHHQHQHQQLHQHLHQQTASGYVTFMSSNQPGMYDQGGLGHSLEAAGYGRMAHHAEPDSELSYEVEHSPLAASSVQSPQTSQSKSPSVSSVAATATSSSSASSAAMTTAPTPTSTTTSAPVEYDGPLTYPTQTYYAMPSTTGSPHEYDFSQQYGHSPPSTGLVDAITQLPKKLRHCCKCGQMSCKGKGGRAHCQNRCQDCHRFECRGRNSKRPDKTCEFAWTE